MMNPLMELKPIFYPAESSVQLDPGSQVLITLDSKGAIDTPRFFSMGQRHYLVTNARDTSATYRREDLLIESTDLDGSERCIRLRVGYELRCPVGNEARMVEAFARTVEPANHLQKRIRFWIDDFLTRSRQRHDADFDSQSFEALSTELKRDLQNRLSLEFGLGSRIQISLEGLDKVAACHIGPTVLSLRFKGHTSRQELELELEHRIDPSLLIRAASLQHRLPMLESRLLSEVARYCETQVSLHQFQYELEARVRPGLEQHLEPTLRRSGRQLVRLTLKQHSVRLGAEDRLETSLEFKCELAEFPNPVGLRIRVRMELQDIGSYANAGAPPLETWVSKTAEDVARSVLFGVKYAELLRDLEKKKEDIKLRMEREAERIGYKIRQLITITDLQPDQLKEKFTLTVRERYATNTAEVTAGLEVVVAARILQTNRIEAYLNRNEDVKQLMAREIKVYLSQQFHGIDPQTFYFNFRTPDAAAGNSGNRPQGAASSATRAVSNDRPLTLELRLRQGLLHELKERFGAEIFDIALKETDSEITEMLRQLRSRSETFIVQVTPLGGQYLPVHFTARLSVTGVARAGWHNFLAKRPSLEDLISTVSFALSSHLQEVHPSELYNLLSRDMLALINEWADERISFEYGLSVVITDWRREPTLEENQAIQRREMTEAARFDEDKLNIEHARVIEKRHRESRLTEADALQARYEAIKDQIAQEREQLMPEARRELEREMQSLRKQLDKLRADDGMGRLSTLHQERGLEGHFGGFRHASLTDGQSKPAPIQHRYASFNVGAGGADGRSGGEPRRLSAGDSAEQGTPAAPSPSPRSDPKSSGKTLEGSSAAPSEEGKASRNKPGPSSKRK